MNTLATPQTTTTWNIDAAHSVAEFKVKHMMISNVKGNSPKSRERCIWTNPSLPIPASRPRLSASSIETRDPQRDAHLKSADFFDVEKFPTLSFKSTRVSLARDGELAVEGDLTIQGVTRKVDLHRRRTDAARRRIPGAIPGWRFRRLQKSTAKTSA